MLNRLLLIIIIIYYFIIILINVCLNDYDCSLSAVITFYLES